jgi:hypothetical protein
MRRGKTAVVESYEELRNLMRLMAVLHVVVKSRLKTDIETSHSFINIAPKSCHPSQV